MPGILLNYIVDGFKNWFIWNRFFLYLKGDSGAPLYYMDPKIGRTRLGGITQSGVQCGGVGYYECVYWYMDWLMKNIHSACLYA